MKWKNKKYVISKGLAFYPELEAIRLKKELENGWLIERVSWFGFYVLKQTEPEESEIVIDFYAGKKTETEEYLDLFQLASWKNIVNYRNRYYFFKAPLGTEPVYTDEETYSARIGKEYSWFLKNTMWCLLIGGLIVAVLQQKNSRILFEEHQGWYGFLQMVGIVISLMPFLGCCLIIYYKAIYPRRKKFYNHPEHFAKKQYFGRDLFFSMVIGGLVGLLTGFVCSILNIF